jgi:diaminohydroxyphosphoribosylaminopyrimidine deaminase/5-amino-6-(5-phosphoribosylamino)uracil reductase
MSLDNDSLMRRALHEARKGTRTVRPNPRVGCVFELKDGTLVEGHHAFSGGPHAERVVLKKIEDQKLAAHGARVAVTLEPCSHTGKTPPCTDALIAAGVAEVIVPFVDPNPLVAGQGLERLKAAGIRVVQGVCSKEAFHINREWLWAKKLGRPFVTLKVASSKNRIGVATDRTWITSPRARQHAMTLRSRVDVLISSGETLRRDDPALTVRDENNVCLPEQPRILVFSQSQDLGSAKKILEHPRWEWHDSKDLETSLKQLASEGIFDVMVECGPDLSKKFLDASLVDELWHYEAQLELKGKPFDLEKLSAFDLVEKMQIDSENIFYKYLHKERNEKNYLKI